MDTTQTLDTKFSAIDKALAAAKARKAAKEMLPPDSATMPDLDIPARKKATDEEKAAKIAERAQKQAQLKADREARKAAKAQQPKGPAHMKKIDRAASKLPDLNDQIQLLFNEVTTNFSAGQITALALHLQHFNRVKATERALNQKVEAGVEVRIVGGDPKFIGMTGTVSKAQRIRCYVTIPGVKRDVYCFTSDVEVVEAVLASTGTEG
jgi:hypothetical protein